MLLMPLSDKNFYFSYFILELIIVPWKIYFTQRCIINPKRVISQIEK